MRRSSELLKWLCLLALVAALHAQSIKTGPEVGQQVPAFSATDQNGRTHDLKSIMGPKASCWSFPFCGLRPFCKIQLVEPQQHPDAIRKEGLGVAAISYDSIGASRVLPTASTSRIRFSQTRIRRSSAPSTF